MRAQGVAVRLQLLLLALLTQLAVRILSDNSCAGGGDVRCVVDHAADEGNGVASSSDLAHNESSHDVADLVRHWGYDLDNGPTLWPSSSPECGGRRQSPVALDTTSAMASHQPRLHWFGWHNLPVSQHVANNGHTVSVKSTYLSEKEVPVVWLSDSERRYRLDSAHFHWGGSEHTLNGERFAMEMHVVTFDRRFPSLEKARSQKNGVLVLAYFFRASATGSAALQQLVSRHLAAVVRPQTSRLVARPLRLSRLAHPFEKSFLLYQGSLTTPPCSQVVRWVLSKDVHSVSRQQLLLLSRLQNDKGKPLVRNWRPLQPLNGRTVTNVF
ncbi:carbonic anhydrase 2-like [Schistocerca americana]|uniref:carbonic anhydrase 2-like n=1 Tax=Schistocerca americana TaxID=7009 RepID=UPI001F4F7FB7|nr:carbonic anhydrase 2-like [Schistocerca americana]